MWGSRPPAFWLCWCLNSRFCLYHENYLLIACLTLWVCGSWQNPGRDGQLWCPWPCPQSLSGRDIRKKALPCMVYISLLQLAWSCSRILRVYTVILLLGLVLNGTWCVFPPQIYRVYQAYGHIGITAWTCCRALSFSRLHWEPAPSTSHSKRVGQYPKFGICYVRNPERSSRPASFLEVGGLRYIIHLFL